MDEIRRTDLEDLKKTLAALGAVVAEVDRQLRYVWIANPHPDFSDVDVLGKRDDELIAQDSAKTLMALKKRTFDERRALSHVLQFHRTDGERTYSLFAYPIVEEGGEVRGILTVGFDLAA